MSTPNPAPPAPPPRSAAPPPPRGAPPNGKPPSQPGSPTAAPTGKSGWQITSGRQVAAQRLMLFGPGGVGKSTLAGLIPGKTIFVDLEGGTRNFEFARVQGISSFKELRALLAGDALSSFDTIVIDTVTKVQELAQAHALATIKDEKGRDVTHIEGYGFGKGYQYIYDTYLLFLADLDRCIDRGQNVCLIAHDCTATVPNPTGEDFIRYEPALQALNSGKAPVRGRTFQWADDVFFIGYDVTVSRDGKGQGGGTRTIWTFELPTHMAKSRVLGARSFPFTSPTDGALWDAYFAALPQAVTS